MGGSASSLVFDYNTIRKDLEKTKTDEELLHLIVNEPFKFKLASALIYLGIIVFLVHNEETNSIERLALSDTIFAEGTKRMSTKKFEDIIIPADNHTNVIAKTIRTGEPHTTTDWKYLFLPALSAEDARFNQSGGGISFSAVYPIKTQKINGAMIFSYYQFPDRIGENQKSFMLNYTKVICDILNRQTTLPI